MRIRFAVCALVSLVAGLAIIGSAPAMAQGIAYHHVRPNLDPAAPPDTPCLCPCDDDGRADPLPVHRPAAPIQATEVIQIRKLADVPGIRDRLLTIAGDRHVTSESRLEAFGTVLKLDAVTDPPDPVLVD